MFAKPLRILLILIFIAPTFFIPNPTYACSCVMPGTPQEEFAAVPVIFEGTAINSAGSVPPHFAWRWRLYRLLSYLPIGRTVEPYMSNSIRFEVKRAWKGVAYDEVAVQTGFGGGDCGYGFAAGRDYLVYASSADGNNLYTHICSRTTEISRAADDLAYLNMQPTLPLTAAPFDYTPLACTIVPLLLLFVGLLMWRKKKQAAITTS